MHFCVLFFFPSLSLSQVCGVRGRGNRIVGGRETGPNEYPWVVGLWRQGTIACGATLVSSSFVMTAAHCVYGLEPEEIRVSIYSIF